MIATITWDLSAVAGDLTDLGTSLILAGGAGIAAGFALFGLQRGVRYLLDLFKDAADGGSAADDPTATMGEDDWWQDYENQEAVLDGRASSVEGKDYMPRNNVGRHI